MEPNFIDINFKVFPFVIQSRKAEKQKSRKAENLIWYNNHNNVKYLLILFAFNQLQHLMPKIIKSLHFKWMSENRIPILKRSIL